MINLFFEYGQKSQDLARSLKLSGFDHPSVVIQDDGFLPADVESPLKYFLGLAGSVFQGRPRYFNEIDLPKLWEIKANAQGGEVLDHGQRRASIIYWQDNRRRQVSRVEWQDLSGRVRLIDHYNQWGWKYAVTSCDSRGRQAMTSYFASNGQEVLIQNHFTGDFTYNLPDGGIRNFTDINQLTAYYLEESGFKLDGVVFNSLGHCLFTLIQLKHKPEHNLLFWQEISQNGVPDNMLYLLEGNLPDGRVIVQDRAEYERITGQLDRLKAARVSYLGMVYPFRRENHARKRALIMTNSDQIECLKQLVEGLPEWHFDIAAVTEMSGRLMNFGHYENVALYPVARTADIDRLLKEDDLYLDVNYANEILQAGRQAFENRLLILAFRDTLHAPEYVSEENIFAARDAAGMIAAIKQLADPAEYARLLGEQEVHAGSESPEHFRKLLQAGLIK
ncbi:glycosyltransferase stabilizing protein Gtf2 [Lactobacillus nasalidis]|uniref:UDP-N-acetylglucosamine--peptide N-acetylglucosaminyltransferase stabilizing protein GtfB n=1 Tax=Lactobacillus nasalidis TaxID=2797258 RepID=A0ABQ3W408_9LACO|nr:accessory Sec system glycosylation chaperone GtfB [Lactobacillus nasalidis]GHV96874.1 glycosyltransferase stabilizing protein Gtf2 [Lactobacillus nasalidis]GHW01076.1 glycosyltransferase stabilizing protein Gtf2 [Lactobacillus nasalidis]